MSNTAEINAIDQELSLVARVLGPLSAFTKALVGPTLGLAQLLVLLVINDGVSAASLTLAVGGVVVGVVTYFAPNVTRNPAAAPVAATAPAGTVAK
jgi:hypothetical protein